MVDSTGTTNYSYDALSRLTGVTFPGSRTVGYTYDDAGRETAITYPGGSNQVAYTYDNANRLATVTDWNSKQTSYAYDDANRMTTATLPNGVVSTSTYDNANRLTGISHVKGGTTLASATYTVDAVGNRSDRTDLAGTQTYSYDNLYRLTSVTYPGPTTTTYSYDAFGNRTQKVDSSGTTSYAYDDADRLTSVTPPSPAPVISYTWDNNGNLTNRGSDSFSWDYEDRMTSANVGGTSWSYADRGDGLRNSATTGGTTRTFTWDVNASLPVILDDDSQYIYGAGLVAQVSGANTYYYLADGLGSTMATTDASGAVVNSYTYDVYGKTTASSGSQPNDFQFAGQQTDPTGLQYLRARYYDPETGGFLSREPLALSPNFGRNSHSYSQSNVPRLLDPTGLYPVDGDFPGGDCKNAYCQTYGPLYDYGYPDQQPVWDEAGGYVDFNATVPTIVPFVVITVGIQVGSNIHVYGGVGVGTPGGSITTAPGQAPTDGLSCQVGGTAPTPAGIGPAIQVGLAGGHSGVSVGAEKGTDVDTPSNPFVELGIGFPAPGWPDTCTIVVPLTDIIP